MTDDVIARAKAALQEYAEAKYHLAKNPYGITGWVSVRSLRN